MKSPWIVVKLDDAQYGAGPGTVLEVSDSHILTLRQRYADRDGAVPDDLRFWTGALRQRYADRGGYLRWTGAEGIAVGDRVSMRLERCDNQESTSPPDAGAPTALAKRLGLSEEQTNVLVSELRNALIPSQHWAKQNANALRGIDRILALASALAKRGGGM